MAVDILFLLSSTAFFAIITTDSRIALESVFLFVLLFIFNRKYHLPQTVLKRQNLRTLLICLAVSVGVNFCLPKTVLKFDIPAVRVAAGAAAIFFIVVIIAAGLKFLQAIGSRGVSFLTDDPLPPSEKAVRMYRAISAVMLVFMAGFMLKFASSQSFWYDELDYTIGKVAGKTFYEIAVQLLKDGYNMPLYYYALALVYPLVPYGEAWILSIGIAAVIAGIIMLSLSAKRLGGDTLGFITLVFSAGSAVLITQGGWECRPYAFYFCFSALTVLMYIKRIQRESTGSIVSLGISMVLLVYSHWFGAVLLVFYGICDLILCIKKRINIKCIISYIMTAAALIPWFVLMLMLHTIDLGSYWGGSPGFSNLLVAYKWLLGSNNLCVVALIAGVSVIITLWIHAARSHKWSMTIYLWVHMLLACVWMPGITFIYSKFINPGGGVFERRYFFALVPHLCLICAFGLCTIGKILSDTNSAARIFPLFMAGVMLSCCWFAVGNATSVKEPFREAAERISGDDTIFTGDTLVISSSAGSAWVEYYFNKRWNKIPANVIDGYGSPLTVIVEDGIIADTEKQVDFSYILGYDRVWYSYANQRTDNGLRNFLNENYSLTDEDKNSRTMLFEK